MSTTIKLLISSVLLLFISNAGFSQNKKLDQVEMFYDQGNYKKVYKQSKKLLKTEEYKSSPTLTLFQSLAEYQLSKTIRKYSDTKAFAGYERFTEMDPDGLFRLKFDIYIYDMQIGIVNDIRRLNNLGNTTEANKKYATFQKIFGNTISFEEITRNAPVIEDELESNTNPKANGKRDDVVKYAEKFIGTPYLYGGNTKKGFDCSGFTQYVMAYNGYNLPRTAQSQSDNLEKIKLSETKKGDLVFFGSSKKNINHVGIIISNHGEPLTMIHASSSKGIMISNIENDTYWLPKIQLTARIITD